MADAGGRGFASTGSAGSGLGAVRRRDGRANAERDLRIHRRIGKAGASRLYARGRHAWHGAAAAAPAVRFYEAVRLQPLAARVRLLPLPPSQINVQRSSTSPLRLHVHLSNGGVDQLDWMDNPPVEAEACGSGGDLQRAPRVAG